MLLSFVFLFGLLIGSFLNVVISRLPLSIHGEAISINHPRRSFCPHCKHTLKAIDLIPLMSFIYQWGKCRYCQQSISIRYPIVEVIAALMSVLIVNQFALSYQSIFYLLFVYGLIVLFVIDLEHQLLPDVITISLLWLGLIFNISDGIELIDSVIGAVVGYLILWSVYHLFKLLTKKEGMGYGDFKLLATLGAWLGWQQLPALLFISSLLGIIYFLLMKIKNNTQTQQAFAFGPFLIIATIVIIFLANIEF
jgi:leader peptidase (prepilin peptidase)/N-methyltransferase